MSPFRVRPGKWKMSVDPAVMSSSYSLDSRLLFRDEKPLVHRVLILPVSHLSQKRLLVI
jgi:hypothetical protein